MQQKRANRRRALLGGGAIAAIIAIIVVLILETSGGGSSKKPAAASTTTTAGSTATTTAATATTAATGTTAAPTAAPPMAPPVTGGQTLTGPTPCPNMDGSSPHVSHFAMAPPACIDATKHYTATFDTTQGAIVVSLDTPATAGTVNNFVTLALYHYYDRSSFDRIDQSIDIIQGGSPATQTIDDPGPGYNINDEPGSQFTEDAQGNLHGPYTYAPGDLVMARGSGRNSASAQYFFVVGPKASALNSQGTYVVFGQVTSGLPILQHIENDLYEPCPATDTACLGGAPSVVVLVNKITISSS